MKEQTSQSQKMEILKILLLAKHTKRKELRYALPFAIPDRKLRSLVEEMIIEDGYCIQSSSNGYSLITTLEQLNEAISYLEAKSKSIAIRKNCLSRNFNSGKLQSQMSLFQSDKSLI
jgi:hypothetical protein